MTKSKDNPLEKISETRKIIWEEGKYSIEQVDANDGKEPYIFPKKNGEYLHCNHYDSSGSGIIENTYTTPNLKVNWHSSHKYCFIGCHSRDFADRLIFHDMTK